MNFSTNISVLEKCFKEEGRISKSCSKTFKTQPIKTCGQQALQFHSVTRGRKEIVDKSCNSSFSRMKLLLLSFIFLLGFIHFGNACCNVTDNTNNTNVLERAFGPVISAKLEDTCEDIKASFQSGLTEQNAQITELLDEKTHEFQEVLQSKFVEQRENLKSFNTKLDEQRKGNVM